MNYLIDAANQYGLQNIAEQTANLPQVHGIIVDIDPLWLSFYKLHLSFPGQNDISERAYYLFRDVSYYYGNQLLNTDFFQKVYFSSVIPIDLQWYPDIWKERMTRSNLVVKILLRPGSKNPEIKYEGQLTLIQEHQPVPRLAAHGIPMFRPLEGGLSVGYSTDAPGTLGGILIDSGKQQYALTCGHVIQGAQADQPAQSDHHSAAGIGQVVFRRDPAGLPPGARCNAYTGGSSEMDIALIKLDSGISGNSSIRHVGNVDGFMPNVDLHPNLQVEFHGRTSGHKTSIVLGGTGLYNEVEDATGTAHCFKNLMEIKDPSMPSLVLNRPVKGGDSGSWVIGQGVSGNEWCGMVVGENRQTGYAITAESILDFLKANHYSLKCK